MKKSNFPLVFTLFLTALFTSLCGEDATNHTNLEDIFVVTARGGIVEIASDRAKIPTAPSNSTLPGNMDSLKEAWKKCYGAMLLGEKNTLNSFFIKGVPRNLQTLEKHDGQVRILMISQINKSIRLILKFELITGPNESNSIYDAQVWRMSEKGKWEVESAIYQ